MRHYVFDESDVVKFKYCPHCGEELYSVYRGDCAGYLECSECDRCEGFYILEEMIFREPKWLINVITAPYEQRISEMNKYKHEQNKRYREALEFYADEETYETKFATDTDEICDPFTLIELDEGKKARKALEEGADD